MEGNGFRRISLHRITVATNHCKNYKGFNNTLSLLKKNNKVTSLQVDIHSSRSL